MSGHDSPVRFKDVGSVLKHFKGEHAENPVRFRCTLCVKEFKQKCSLDKHIAVHTTEKCYKCSTCGRSFALRGNLRTHQRIHQDKEEREIFNCQLCPWTCLTQSGVQRHVKTRHGNEKKTASYQCTLCDKALTRSTGVTLHMQANHPTNEMPIHSCEKCGYKSRMKFALTRHVQRVHDRVKRTECYFCGKKFFDFKDLVSHYPYFRKIRHVNLLGP
ncbi:Zinc finger protein 2 [Folsomia candida]|uniref:Zinc finger protein 2 n=1 Tax=Folsomia candida TaxID=158441 RepID=A0A226CX86_FOLCA|nr:Zinc finger protein 2 [Folsomia candida]